MELPVPDESRPKPELPSCAFANYPTAFINQYYQQIFQENYIYARANLLQYHHHYSSSYPLYNQWPDHGAPVYEQQSPPHACSKFASASPDQTFTPYSSATTSCTPDASSPESQCVKDDSFMPYKLEIDLDRPPDAPVSPKKDPVGKVRVRHRQRAPYTKEQISILESQFQINQYLTCNVKYALSHATGLTETQVKNWYQNRRMREKKGKAIPKRDAKTNCHSKTDTPSYAFPPNQETATNSFPTLRRILAAGPQDFRLHPENPMHDHEERVII